MSRTYKDKKYKYRSPEYDWNYDRYFIARFCWLQKAGVKTKKRKKVDTEWHWMSTPSAWTRSMMNRPQRRKCRLWEHKILFEDIEEADCPWFKNKPHIYYW